MVVVVRRGRRFCAIRGGRWRSPQGSRLGNVLPWETAACLRWCLRSRLSRRGGQGISAESCQARVKAGSCSGRVWRRASRWLGARVLLAESWGEQEQPGRSRPSSLLVPPAVERDACRMHGADGTARIADDRRRTHLLTAAHPDGPFETARRSTDGRLSDARVVVAAGVWTAMRTRLATQALLAAAAANGCLAGGQRAMP